MKKSFILYSDQINLFKKLNGNQVKNLMLEIFKYSNGASSAVQINDPVVDMAFEAIKTVMDRDNDKYLQVCEKNRENIQKRWNTKNTTVYDRIRPDTKHTDSDSDSENDNKKKNIKKKKNFVPPSENDVVSFFKEKEFTEASAKKAYEYYDTANWHDSTGKKIKNWKQKMIAVWFKDENKESKYGW